MEPSDARPGQAPSESDCATIIVTPAPDDARNEPKAGTKEGHKSGGFSASQFADYEQRLKADGSSPGGHRVSFSETVLEKSFEQAIALEKGLATPSRTHARTDSQASFRTDVTVSTSACSTASTVPDKRQSRWLRNIRHTSLNVYRRLFSIVFILNMVGLIVLLSLNKTSSRIDISHVSTAASANILVAIIIRQDYVVNFMFRSCWLVPLSAPLRLRRMLAKIYEHGGVHSGAGVAGTIWLILLTVLVTINFADRTMRSIPVLTFSYVLLLLLLTIIVFAYPRFRFMSHNSFERTHRFAGWIGIALFWVELLLIAHQLSLRTHRNMGIELIEQPTFWFLAVITFHIILPWLRLRKWTFRPEVLSNHALRLHFDKTLKPFSGLAISDNPLLEWHPFATFPARDGAPGGSMIISDAGDWTKNAIAHPKTRYWVKGVPKTGVLSMACIFRNVVVVTTGSGIGPCLSFLTDQTRRQPARVVWSTPSPLRTFGQEIVDAVRGADPEAVIIDTRASGRPNMVEITYRLYVESGAEAVFVISNPRLTRKIVYSMESRGVPAFGPVWDS